MVAPIQGSVGTSSSDTSTQSYLSDLDDFYKKSENEGVVSNFTAPDGTNFQIDNASYLSSVTSDVNSGKYDSNKEVSQDADMSLGSNKTTKSENTNGKNEEKQKNDVKDKQAEADSSQKDGEGAQSECLGKSQGQGVQDGVDTKPEAIESSAGQTIAKKDAEGEALTKKATEVKAKNLSEKKQTDQLNKKLTADTAKLNLLFKAAVKKLDAKIKAKAAKRNENSEAMPAKAQTQSGSKMGFEGRLMTEVSSGAGNSTDQSWEATMNGPKAAITEKVEKQQAELVAVRAEGDKAAMTFDAQASASDTAAAGNLKEAKKNRTMGNVSYAIAGVTGVLGVVETVKGVKNMVKGVKDIVTAPALCPVWLAVLAKIGCGIINIGWAIIKNFGTAIASFGSMVGGIMQGRGSMKAADANTKEAANLDAQAADQRTQGSIARKKAVSDANKTNADTIAATQKINAMANSLGNSDLPAVSVDNEQQLEAVKEERYNQIMDHEKQHAAVIGGSPVIKTDSNGVAIGGYVQIDLPSVKESDLEGSIEKAQKVIKAALAPSNPSSQDRTIASQAQNVLDKAQSLLEEKTKKAEENQKDNDKPKEDEDDSKKETKEN